MMPITGSETSCLMAAMSATLLARNPLRAALFCRYRHPRHDKRAVQRLIIQRPAGDDDEFPLSGYPVQFS